MRNVQPGDTVTNVAYVNGNPTEEVSTKKNPKVNIIKIEKGDKTQTMLAGAVYSVQNSEGQSVKDVYGNIVGDITTLSTEPIILELPYGSYQLVEKKAPEGYKINNAPITFQVTENSKTVNVVAEDELVPTTGNLIIKKTDENGNLLNGAKFSLMQGDKVIVTGISQDGLVSFNNIKAGTYTIVENEAPKGYIVASDENVDIVAGETLNKTIVNNKIKGNIQITKVDSTDNNKKLQEAEFTVKSLDGKISETKETNGDGLVEFDNLPYGSYTYEERKAPEGYVLDTTKVNFEVTENGKLLTFTAEDDPIQGDIQINKVDSETGDELVGAKFEIRDSENNLVDTITTDKQGVATLSGLKYGDYTFQEVKAPIGYGIDSSKIPFTVSEHGKTLEFTAKNTKIKGGIKITKVDSETKKVLEEAIFNVKDSNGNVVGTQATGDNGAVEFNNLPYGDYTFREITAPIGYILDETPVKFSITENDKIIEFTAENNIIKGGIKITKYDSETNKILEGATFVVKDSSGNVVDTKITDENGVVEFNNLPYGTYTYEETKAQSGYLLNTNPVTFKISENNEISSYRAYNNKDQCEVQITKVDLANANIKLEGAKFEVVNKLTNNVDGILVTNADGVASIKLAPGTYKLVEVDAPIGYIKSDIEKEFTIISGETTPINIQVANGKIHGGVKITKVDSETGAVLSGAEFEVKNGSGISMGIKTTDENGVVDFGDLPYGDYTFTEIKAPEGYLLDKTPVEFSILENGRVIGFTAKDDLIKGNMQITKVDSETGDNLAGAKFDIKDSTGKLVQTVTTDAQGIATISGLTYGDYTFQEVVAPTGYILSTEVVPFKVSEHGKTLEFTAKNTEIKGGIKITKVDSENNKVLEGATFQVKDSNGNVVNTQDTNELGIAEFNNLPYGDYTFVETKAPTGYQLDSTPVNFSIAKNNKILEFTAKNNIIKGGIKIVKVDSESNKALEGAEFTIKDSIGNIVATGMTDKDGILEFDNLSYGNYTYEETKAPGDKIIETPHTEDKSDDNITTLPKTGGLLSERVILILGIGLMILSLVLAVIVNKKRVK